MDGDYGEFVLELFVCGYGVIIGNFIWCILMFLIFGIVVMSVYIEDVLYEFSIIFGVWEDVICLIFNFKELVVKFYVFGFKILILCV